MSAAVPVLSLDMLAPLKLNASVPVPNTLTLSWTGGPGIRLQRTSSLTVPEWRDEPGSEGVSHMELPRDTAAAFFRLIRP